jgi:hypothetical protein
MRIGGPETVILLPLVAAANQSLRGYFEPQRGGGSRSLHSFLGGGSARNRSHTPASYSRPVWLTNRFLKGQ